MPCFCGCERSGHRGNEDCFVRERAANGDVIEWDDHGMECAVCLDVATRSRQMLRRGASVAEIFAPRSRKNSAGTCPMPHADAAAARAQRGPEDAPV